MRLFTLMLAVLLLLFQYGIWFGKNGYSEYKLLQQTILAKQEANQKLSQRNQLIAAEIKDLKEGVDAIEERGRLDYEMVKPDEVFYRLIKENK